MEEKRVKELEKENGWMKARIDGLERELKACKSRLEDLSRRADLDYLTGVLNREGICRLISSYLEEEGNPGALCFLDLDNFKQINDKFGHSSGDEALCAIAQTLQAGVLEGDTVGRFGGDEFLIYMRGVTGEADIMKRAEAICSKIRSLPLAVHLTASVGIACYPEHGCEFQELLDKADAALYQSKCSGKDKIILLAL